MNYQDIKISEDATHFLYQNKLLFKKIFKEVLKFHTLGLAPVLDESGVYHIDTKWKLLNKKPQKIKNEKLTSFCDGNKHELNKIKSELERKAGISNNKRN